VFNCPWRICTIRWGRPGQRLMMDRPAHSGYEADTRMSDKPSQATVELTPPRWRSICASTRPFFAEHDELLPETDHPASVWPGQCRWVERQVKLLRERQYRLCAIDSVQ